MCWCVFCSGPALLACGVYRAYLLFRAWCARRVRCAGCRKVGEWNPSVWFHSPTFSCVEQMTGLEPAASTLGGWRSSW